MLTLKRAQGKSYKGQVSIVAATVEGSEFWTEKLGSYVKMLPAVKQFAPEIEKAKMILEGLPKYTLESKQTMVTLLQNMPIWKESLPEQLLTGLEARLLSRLGEYAGQALGSDDVKECHRTLILMHEATIMLPLQASLHELHGLLGQKLQELKAASASQELKDLCAKLKAFWSDGHFSPSQTEQPKPKSPEELVELLQSFTSLMHDDMAHGKLLDAPLREQLHGLAETTSNGVADWLLDDVEPLVSRMPILVSWFHGLGDRLEDAKLKQCGDGFTQCLALKLQLKEVASSDAGPDASLDALQHLRRTLMPLTRICQMLQPSPSPSQEGMEAAVPEKNPCVKFFEATVQEVELKLATLGEKWKVQGMEELQKCLLQFQAVNVPGEKWHTKVPEAKTFEDLQSLAQETLLQLEVSRVATAQQKLEEASLALLTYGKGLW